MSKYIKEATLELLALPDLLPPVTPRTTHGIWAKLSNLQLKLQNQLSSPSQRQFDSIEHSLHTLLDASDITRVERGRPSVYRSTRPTALLVTNVRWNAGRTVICSS